MIRLNDGPAEGKCLELKRAPRLLRVVIDMLGEVDALDQLDDEPEPNETIHVYQLGRDYGHICIRSGKGRGCYSMATYRHRPDVDGETVRETEAWRAWATADAKAVAS